MSEFSREGSEARPRLLAGTVKVAAATALITFLAAHWLTNGFDRTGAMRLAGWVRQPVPDPVTTGSVSSSPLAEAARSTRLNPCIVLRP